MLPSPLPWKCLLFLPLLSFSLQFSLILESLCLPGTHALSGNDVNRVKCFQGPRGRETQCDFGEWLTSAEKHQEAKCSSSFLHRLVLCHTYSICAAQVSGSLVYSLSSVRFFFVVFSALEAAIIFSLASSLFHFCLSSRQAILSFSHHHLAVWEASQDFRSTVWVWTSHGEVGHWLGPFLSFSFFFFTSSKHVHI